MRKFLSKFDLGSTESNSLEIPMGRRRASKHRSAFKGGTHYTSLDHRILVFDYETGET